MLETHFVDDARGNGDGFIAGAAIVAFVVVVVGCRFIAGVGGTVFVASIQGDLRDELFVKENELRQRQSTRGENLPNICDNGGMDCFWLKMALVVYKQICGDAAREIQRLKVDVCLFVCLCLFVFVC